MTTISKFSVQNSEQITGSLHPLYRPDIDGLRAIAVLAVVCSHAFPTLLPGGFVGVDVFFIISGFLISDIIISQLHNGSFCFSTFYARRIRRIFPALILVMVASSFFGWFALFPDEYMKLGKHVLGGAAFISNFILWNEVSYFDTAAETKPFLHLWSLGIEEQFYIVWPVLLVLARNREISVLAIMLTLALISFIVNIAGVVSFPSATFYFPTSRAWELMMGALLAYLAVTKSKFSQAPVKKLEQIMLPLCSGERHASPIFNRNIWSFIGLFFIVTAYCFVTRDKPFPGWWALLPVFGATLLIASGQSAWVNNVILSNRVLVWFGLISYPLYLWHWPLLSFAQIIESGIPSPAIRTAVVLVAILLAWLTYRLLEKPLRGNAHEKMKVMCLLALMVFVVTFSVQVYLRRGLPERPSITENSQLQKSLILVEDVANATACKKRYGFSKLSEYCLIDQVDKAPTVALIGDSHAYHLVAGLTKYYKNRGENLLLLGTRIPFWDVESGTDEYQQATNQMLDLALKTASIKTVIISTAAKLNTDDDKGAAIVLAFRETLRRFVQNEKRVIFINDLPWLDFEPRSCIKRAGIASSRTRLDCSMSRIEFDKKTARHYTLVQSVLSEFPSVYLFSTIPYLCDDKRCSAMIDHKLIYRDTHHLSYEGDLYMGEKFAQELATSNYY